MPTSKKLIGSTYPYMKALIIYDDFTSAAKANAALQCSAHHLQTRIKWNVRPWRLDMLKFPPTAEEALDEAIDAHLIIFAGLTDQPLPSWLFDWLEHWAKCRRIDEAALAVVDDGTKHTASPLAMDEISQFAERRGLAFIISDLTAGETDRSISVHRVPEHSLPLLTIQTAPVSTAAHDSYHQLGIND